MAKGRRRVKPTSSQVTVGGPIRKGGGKVGKKS